MNEIRLPKKIQDCRIKHFEAVKYLTEIQESINLPLKIKVIEKFTGVKYSDLITVNRIDLEKIYNHIIGIFGRYKPSVEPPKEITIQGVTYELIDPNKVGVAWHIDVTGLEVDKNPVMMASVCYFPKGAKYGEVDDNENIIHPIKDRVKIFEEHFPLDVFIDLNAFFLSKWFQYQIRYDLKEKTAKRVNNVLKELKLR